MKLKSLSKIEFCCDIIIAVILLPLVLVEIICDCVSLPFKWAKNKLVMFRLKIGNYLLKKSDEVRNGTIKNSMCLRTYTASFALKELERMVDLK